MHLLWWQQLPLIILFQLLESNITSQKLYVEALVARKSNIGHASGRIGRYVCLRPAISHCYKLNEPGIVTLSTRRHPLYLQTEIIELLPANFIHSNSRVELQKNYYKSRNSRRVSGAIKDENDVPTLTPLQSADDKKPSKQKVAGIVGGVGAAALVIVIIILVYLCLMRIKKFLRHSSEAASSMPSPPPELRRGNISPYAAPQSPLDTQNLRQLSIAELKHATTNFSHSNIIGEGVFGVAYKGLLLDGSIVAIKRCLHNPFPDFVHQVKRIASVHHKHLVDLIGYCEDRHQQFLVYDYIANGNVGNYLYDSEGLPIGRLDMRQRMSIALGAAKGLQHLHSLNPPLLHMHFRTSNVLLGDKFTKVSDFGVLRLLMEGYRAGSSSATDCFINPDYGVFLLELISGRAANGKYQSSTGRNLVQEGRECRWSEFVDKSIEEHGREAARRMMKLALECVDIRRERPSMSRVVEEIEEIQGTEMGDLKAEIGEEIGSVTLGSELFK